MSFQAYLDAIEEKTGLTSRQLVDIANQKGFNDSTARPATLTIDRPVWWTAYVRSHQISVRSVG